MTYTEEHRPHLSADRICWNIVPNCRHCPLAGTSGRGCTFKTDDIRRSEVIHEIPDEELAEIAGVPAETLRERARRLAEYLGLE